jgi:hypothetical protein
MEGKLQTAFIPKTPLVEKGVKKTPVPVSIISVIGWFIFIIAIIASVGVFLYEQYLTKAIDSKNTELSNRVKSFDVASVDHFIQLNARLQAAADILDNHLAFSTLLSLIADNTIRSIQFTDFKYAYDDGGKITLNLSGKAPDFASVALQSDNFSSEPYLQNQVFSGLGLAQDGGVLFKFTSSVDPSALKYKGVN